MKMKKRKENNIFNFCLKIMEINLYFDYRQIKILKNK